MPTLMPCPRCRRHARAGDCPFCGEKIGAVMIAPRRSKRLTRFAIFAGAALATTACSSSHNDTDGGPTDSGSATVDAGVDGGPDSGFIIAPPYGTPPIDSGL